jgi:hypothetical protein
MLCAQFVCKQQQQQLKLTSMTVSSPVGADEKGAHPKHACHNTLIVLLWVSVVLQASPALTFRSATPTFLVWACMMAR